MFILTATVKPKSGTIGFRELIKFGKFIRYVNNDKNIRKYYRYLRYNGPFRFVLLLFFMFTSAKFPRFFCTLTGYYFIIIYIKSSEHGNLEGICHVKVKNHKNKDQLTGDLGIVIAGKKLGEGLGTILMSECLDKCKSIGIKKVELEVDLDNARGIALYKKFGFTELEVIKNGDFRYITNEYVDCVKMELNLD